MLDQGEWLRFAFFPNIVTISSTDKPGSSSPLASFGRSIWSIRREQVRDRFHDLSEVSADELLSIAWIRKLLDVLVCCQEEFRIMLVKNRVWVSKPPLDRLVAEFFERSVKSLEIGNATRNGIENVRLWQKHLEIVVCALESRQRALGEGQNRSFGRHNTSKGHHRRHSSSSGARSLAWSASHSWSAAKQLQSIANNLIPPRGNEIAATSGLAVPIFTMGYVLMFALWVLAAAIPCQDRGLNIHFSIPRQFSWRTPLHSLHERILEV
ncbi:hypothetical protein I3760_05G042400 [Carya illinoinensis]|nr:hypothetical protein I3760_05G042400 [Carya illinoinensis]